jgi:putative acetyltransferase
MATSNLQLRELRASDNAALAAIIREVMPEFGACGAGFAINDAEVDRMFEAYSHTGARYFVITNDTQLLGGGGIAALAGGDADVCELRKMYFLRPLRGLGWGQRLLTHCLEAARALGYRRCYLETLTGMNAAQYLYRRAGFKPLAAPLGATGHFGCDRYFLLDL